MQAMSDLEGHLEIVDALEQVRRVVPLHAVVRALCLGEELLLLGLDELRVVERALTRRVERRQEPEAVVPELRVAGSNHWMSAVVAHVMIRGSGSIP